MTTDTKIRWLQDLHTGEWHGFAETDWLYTVQVMGEWAEASDNPKSPALREAVVVHKMSNGHRNESFIRPAGSTAQEARDAAQSHYEGEQAAARERWANHAARHARQAEEASKTEG